MARAKKVQAGKVDVAMSREIEQALRDMSETSVPAVDKPEFVEQSERATYEALLVSLQAERAIRLAALLEIEEAIKATHSILNKDAEAARAKAKAEREAAIAAYGARPKFQAVMAAAWIKAGTNKTVTDKGYSAQLQLDATLFAHPLSKPAAWAWVKAKSDAANIELAKSGKTMSIGLVFVTPKVDKS